MYISHRTLVSCIFMLVSNCNPPSSFLLLLPFLILFFALLFVNVFCSAGSRYEDYTANSICSVYSNGRVVWQSPTIITTHCSMDVTNFPFDYQECPLTFGPWQHGADEITLNGTGRSPSPSSPTHSCPLSNEHFPHVCS